MTKKKTNSLKGRHKKVIDWNLFESLCEIQCTQSEIANVLKINVDTLHDRAQANYCLSYSEIYKKFSDVGKMSLRRTQFRLAQKNVAMAIWLGKQYLGQKDNITQHVVNEEMEAKLNEVMKMLAEAQTSAKNKAQESSSTT